MNRRWIRGTRAGRCRAGSRRPGKPAGILYHRQRRGPRAPSSADCIERPFRRARREHAFEVTVPSTGWVTARLTARVGRLGPGRLRPRAPAAGSPGSACFGASEIAQGFVAGGARGSPSRPAGARAARGTARLTRGVDGDAGPEAPEAVARAGVDALRAARKGELRRARPRPDRARRRRLRRGGPPRRGRRREAARGQVRLHHRDRRPRRAELRGTARPSAGYARRRARPRRCPAAAPDLPAPRRLQQRDEDAGRAEPDARQADHAAVQDLHRAARSRASRSPRT